MRLLLALLIVAGMWSWDASPTATGYFFCWSHSVTYWNLGYCTDVGNVLTFDPTEFDPLWAVESNPGSIVYFQVVAYNSAGIDPNGQTFADPPSTWVCP